MTDDFRIERDCSLNYTGSWWLAVHKIGNLLCPNRDLNLAVSDITAHRLFGSQKPPAGYWD
jgi:hypothetical protein